MFDMGPRLRPYREFGAGPYGECGPGPCGGFGPMPYPPGPGYDYFDREFDYEYDPEFDRINGPGYPRDKNYVKREIEYPIVQKPLPYPLNGLAPVISPQTLEQNYAKVHGN